MGKGVLGARETRGAREEGGRETPASSPPPSSLLPRAWSRALIPFPFPLPFERLPRRLAIELQGNITKKNITKSSEKIQAEHVVRKLLQ